MTTKKTLSFSQMLQAQIDKAARKRASNQAAMDAARARMTTEERATLGEAIPLSCFMGSR
jgi:hypothetical protein